MDKKFIIPILILLLVSTSKSLGTNLDKLNIKDDVNNIAPYGVITLMYHRFNENKYPSTNIRNEIFIKQLDEINKLNIEFINFKKFEEVLKSSIKSNYVLLTIDDAFESFFVNAWPILKKKKNSFLVICKY